MWPAAAILVIAPFSPELRRCLIADPISVNLSTALTICQTRSVFKSQLKDLCLCPRPKSSSWSTGQLRQEKYKNSSFHPAPMYFMYAGCSVPSRYLQDGQQAPEYDRLYSGHWDVSQSAAQRKWEFGRKPRGVCQHWPIVHLCEKWGAQFFSKASLSGSFLSRACTGCKAVPAFSCYPMGMVPGGCLLCGCQ